MRRPWSLLPALVVAAATVVPAVVLPATPAGAAPPLAAAAEEEGDPLLVTIDVLTPSEVPERGEVTMSGTVTNVSEERWRAVNVHAFVGRTPMTTSAQLAAAREVPDDADVGERIFIPGTFDSLGGLDPGEQAPFEITLKRDQIPAELPGVYWFGAHALGNTTEIRDSVADGRARTFLPLVEKTRPSVSASVVVPLRRSVQHTHTGRIIGEGSWAQDLEPGGRLSALLDLGAAARNRPVTWLIDPALPDAVKHLVEGNRPRSLSDSSEPQQPDDGTPSPSGSSSAAPVQDAAPGEAVVPGRDWLGRLDDALGGSRVLALPYGDVDVSAAHDHAPELLRAARLHAGEQLDAFHVSTAPAVAPPGGFLSTEALADLPSSTQVLLADRMLPADVRPRPLDVDGARVLFTTSDVAEGGPGPDDPLGTVAVRQRILAEAAVRTVDQRRTPLVVMLPQAWTPDRDRAFWRGLDVPWLSLTDAASLTAEDDLSLDRLDYPAEQRLAELPAASFAVAEQVQRSGQVLANVLTNNDEIGTEVTGEVLTSVSYGARQDPDLQQLRSDESLRWLERRTHAVRVRAPRGVTLSSASGGFATTLTNRLDHPVTISLKAITDASLAVETPPTIDLAARGRQTVVLDARTTSPGVHYVRLIVTDDTGAPLGSSATLPVRSAEVSQVIWLILGVGVGLLFLAIAVRLVRRIRSERT